MKHRLPILMFFLPILCCLSCNDEENPLPDYVEDLACLTTNYAGWATHLCLDNGQKLQVKNEVKGLKNDSTYRVLAIFKQQVEDGTAWIASYTPILAPEAIRYKHPHADPLTVVACWKSGHFINFRLKVKGTYNSTHYFGFHLSQLHTAANGNHTVCIQLVHDQNKDPLYYSREAYLSLPTDPIQSVEGVKADSVKISIHTFDSQKQFVFPL